MDAGLRRSYPGAGVTSANRGATWSLRTACLCRRIGKLVVDPSNAQRSGFAATQVWNERTTAVELDCLRADTVTDVVLDPTSASTIFIGVAGNGYLQIAPTQARPSHCSLVRPPAPA